MTEIEYVGKCLLVKEGRKKILAVGDLHLGYEEALQRSGVYVPRQLFREVLEELEWVFERVEKVHQVVLLGDVKHTFGGVLQQERGDVLKLIDWLAERAAEVVLIKGNHDVILAPIAWKRKLCVKDFHIVGGTAFVHGDRDFPEIHEHVIHLWIVGHAHPAITLRDGIKEEKYKCFLAGTYRGKEVVIVPSFAEHSEGSDPREHSPRFAWDFNIPRWKVRVVEGLDTLEFGELRKL